MAEIKEPASGKIFVTNQFRLLGVDPHYLVLTTARQ